MSITLNDEDPCATASALRQAYTNLVAGTAAQVITFEAGANGVKRSTTFHKADPGRLLMVVREWEAKCAAAGGARPKQFAMRGGGMLR